MGLVAGVCERRDRHERHDLGLDVAHARTEAGRIALVTRMQSASMKRGAGLDFAIGARWRPRVDHGACAGPRDQRNGRGRRGRTHGACG